MVSLPRLGAVAKFRFAAAPLNLGMVLVFACEMIVHLKPKTPSCLSYGLRKKHNEIVYLS